MLSDDVQSAVDGTLYGTSVILVSALVVQNEIRPTA